MDHQDRKPMANHRWSFTRIGGVDQLVIRDGKDIAAIPELDQTLWAALAMPASVAGIASETRTILDADGDGRIRASEITRAIMHLRDSLTDLDMLVQPGDSVPLAAIKDPKLADAARWMVGLAGSAAASSIAIADVEAASALFGSQRLNGDGVLTPETLEGDTEAAAFAARVIAWGGGVADAGGSQGVDRASLEAYLDQGQATLAWMEAFEADPLLRGFGVVGAESASEALQDLSAAGFWAAVAKISTAVGAFRAVQVKLEDWFLRCALVAPSARESAGGGILDFAREEERQRLRSSTIDPADPVLTALPLALPLAPARLDLGGPFNPAWESAMAAFRSAVATPLAGAAISSLDRPAWETLRTGILHLASWVDARPSQPVQGESLESLVAILGSPAITRLGSLMDEDAGEALKRTQIDEMRSLLVLRRDLFRVLVNFVSFSEFYTRGESIFQAGTLYLDGRACSLCFDVEDAGKHAALAGMSAACLAYCSLSRKDLPGRTIVAAFTAGSGENLFVGRNGVFYDREGADWDATITKVVIQPISMHEAFWSPYRWLGKTLEELASSRAKGAEAASLAKLKGGAESAVAGAAAVGSAATGAVPATTAAQPKKSALAGSFDVGTVAAIGVALGSLGVMVTGILAAFIGMGPWMPLGFLGALILISGPSMLLAWFKLRKRNLGPILDACGWAINGRLKINVPFGRSLTFLASLPPGATRSMTDPYAEKRGGRILVTAGIIILFLAILWLSGAVDGILPLPWTFSALTGR